MSTAALGALSILLAASCANAQPHGVANEPLDPIDWREGEAGILDRHVQLTFEEDWLKAGEAYFNPNGDWIIFQAIPQPAPGEAPDRFYSMYVAPLEFDDGRPVGIGEPIRVSPPGSANTCGFFHPLEADRIIFGSTMGEPSPSAPPGFQRESSQYVWMFPPEMEVVSCRVPAISGDPDTPPTELTPITDNPTYDAECVYSPDGRHLLYCSLQSGAQLGDLYVIDTATGESTPLVTAAGYDGGPFFSPDGTRICYRSDRDGSNLLQIFVSELEFNDRGQVTGVAREFQLTNDQNVNWAPYWHPGGKHLVYATSAVSHRNYEVFIVDAAPGDPNSWGEAARYGSNQRRVTTANGFDGLPVFSPDGRYMMWTSQRTDDPAGKGSSQLWLADFVMELDPPRSVSSSHGSR